MEKIRIFQKGFNYSQDGQGNRLVYHLQGCNMKCPWCANPEGMKMEGALYLDKDWIQDELCPKGAVKEKVLDRSVCAKCDGMECQTVKYKNKGLRLSFEEYTTDEIFDEILRSSPMFYDGGGVTFTGGEATMQFDALKELLIRLTKAGVHTVIETNGANPRLPELFPYIDQLIMDCKHLDAKKHMAYTGVPFDMVDRNLKHAAEVHKHLDIRIPFIGGVNDSEEDMEMFTRYLKELAGENVTVEILKYHEFGKNKWEACGMNYQMTEKAHVTIEQIQYFQEKLKKNGIQLKKS